MFFQSKCTITKCNSELCIQNSSWPYKIIWQYKSFSVRRGREVKVPFTRGRSPGKAIKEMSFQVHGAKLFNALPKSIKNLRKISIEDFKFKLDKLLEGIQDEPKLPGYVPHGCNQISAVPSNSIIDRSRTASLDSRRPG